MTSPNREALAQKLYHSDWPDAKPEAWANHIRAGNPRGPDDAGVRYLKLADIALSTAIADRDRYKDALAASEVRNFELAANQCEAGYGGEGGSHRCRYQDDSREAWNEGIREAAEAIPCHFKHPEGCPSLGADLHMLKCPRSEVPSVLALLTQPDRSAARQKVIDRAVLAMEDAAFEPPESDVGFEGHVIIDWHPGIQLREAVQELQSPNKEEQI